jgi:hypothetical protein
LRGGAPRAVWLAFDSALGEVSVQSAAARLISERRPCHLVWDPATGEIGQLISVLRAGRALGAADGVGWAPDRVRACAASVNADGRICVQIGVLGYPGQPFTAGPMIGIDAIMSWLDSWYVPRRWPSGQPEAYPGAAAYPALVARGTAGRGRSKAHWARGGHFGASQVPGCDNTGPGAIEVDRLTGPHGFPMRARDLQVSLPEEHALRIPA